MRKKIRIFVADPAGNITIFVKDKFSRECYQSIAAQLLDIKEFKGEQVCFILDEEPDDVSDGKMEMCGLEFCGNASRTFGLMTAENLGIKGKASIKVDVSGSEEILTVQVDTETGYTKIRMPSPRSCRTIDLSGLSIKGVSQQALASAQAVDFGGILHIVLKDVPAVSETFEMIKNFINEKYNPPAMGVMFYDTMQKKLIPVVYVKDVDTTYFEGSCGSGTTACAVAFSQGKSDGNYFYSFPQPAGTIDSTVEIRNGKTEAVYIEGTVYISEEKCVEIDI